MSTPWQTPIDGINASVVSIFNPVALAPGALVDECFTVRRLIFNRFPVLDISATLVSVADPYVAQLTWFLYIDDVTNTNIPTSPTQLFQSGKDIIQGGTLISQAFGSTTLQQGPPWYALPGNYIDTKVARKINTGEQLIYWSFGSFVPTCENGTPVVPGEDDPPACWLHNPDVSVLYQRTMRRR